MSDDRLASILARATVDEEVYALRPDYRALLVAVDGIEPAVGASAADTIVRRAEESARETLAELPVEQVPHVAAWRDAYRAFGAKPQRTRHSLEALLRRAPEGLPRVNLLTDIYNAVSVLHLVPVGGEDLSRYAGPPRLIRASGQEPFDTLASGEPVVEHPEPGEVVWCDDDGVTCRRWNWRQARRTALRKDTTSALFILDALAPMTDGELAAAANDLVTQLRVGPRVQVAQRLLRAAP
jgi:DNA/RNA-binding domain of Phe-tRNA-synthetase-like protein